MLSMDAVCSTLLLMLLSIDAAAASADLKYDAKF